MRREAREERARAADALTREADVGPEGAVESRKKEGGTDVGEEADGGLWAV